MTSPAAEGRGSGEGRGEKSGRVKRSRVMREWEG